MAETNVKRQTSADIVFESIYDEIISLGLLPGSKISEVEIADRFGVSRQPVRDAFNRLGNLELLQIQPQRATQVRKFSLSGIAAARFIRLAIELELARSAIENWSDKYDEQFKRNLAEQTDTLSENDLVAFHALDEEFHRLIAEVADKPFAFDLILQKKAQVDRICVLSLKDRSGTKHIVDDHATIYHHIRNRDIDKVDAALRLHLSRIEPTIAAVCHDYPEYFEE